MKKRIISLLLALSMMISLVPVSALANTGGGIDPAAYASNEPLPDLVMNSATGLPMAESGNGWTYSGGKLTLTSGEWNFSYTHPANGAGETLSEVYRSNQRGRNCDRRHLHKSGQQWCK